MTVQAERLTSGKGTPRLAHVNNNGLRRDVANIPFGSAKQHILAALALKEWIYWTILPEEEEDKCGQLAILTHIPEMSARAWYIWTPTPPTRQRSPASLTMSQQFTAWGYCGLWEHF